MTTKPQSTTDALPPEDMTDDELKAAISFHERQAMRFKSEGAKLWRLRLRIGKGEPIDRKMLAELQERRASRVFPPSAAPVVDNFESWIKNYWPDWQKAEPAPIELMRAAWDAATRLVKFNESALKGAIDYTIELETKLAAATEQPNQLTQLQQAMIEHDDDMARLDRNTMAVTSPAAATAAPVEQSEIDAIRARAYNSIQFSADVYMHDVRRLLRMFVSNANKGAR